MGDATVTHLRRVVPDRLERGAGEIEVARAWICRAKRELLQDLAEEYLREPHRDLTSTQVATRLLQRAEELEHDSEETR